VGGAASPQTRSAYAARCTAPMHIDIYAIYVSAFIKRRVKCVLHLSKRSTLQPSRLCKAEIQFIKRRATQNRKPTPRPVSTKTTTTTPHATAHKQTTPTKPTQNTPRQNPKTTTETLKNPQKPNTRILRHLKQRIESHRHNTVAALLHAATGISNRELKVGSRSGRCSISAKPIASQTEN
jgi:hypothetical protein